VRSSRQRADTWPTSAASSKSLYTFVTAVSVLWKRRYTDYIGGIMSLLLRNAWSLHWTTLSNNLDRNARNSSSLRHPNHFSLTAGQITACLNSEGKQPETGDALNSRATKGDSRLCMSFTSHVNTGSSWHVLMPNEHRHISRFHIKFLIRPPVRSNGRTYKMLVMFSFFQRVIS